MGIFEDTSVFILIFYYMNIRGHMTMDGTVSVYLSLSRVEDPYRTKIRVPMGYLRRCVTGPLHNKVIVFSSHKGSAMDLRV